MRDLNRFRGSLVGGAAGDALGYAIEFLPESAIFSRYGRGGITEYELQNGVAIISDDTQMTLFTAAGLLSGTAGGHSGNYPESINSAYLDWLQTQGYAYRNREIHTSWLMNVPELYHRRAPGNTCLNSLVQGGGGSVKDPINKSKGCGGVMRVAPVGLYFCDRKETIAESDRIGAEAAALTHGHPLGYLPGAALAHIIRRIVESGDTVEAAAEDSIAAIQEMFPYDQDMDKFVTLMERAVQYARMDCFDLDCIHDLGEGWVGDEALAIAVYCAIKYQDDFDRCMIASVNHRGDSDSTGAVAGNIVGAYLGYDAIPQKYKTNLEILDVILEIADDLCRDCQMKEGVPSDPLMTGKYITAEYLKH